MPLSRISVAEYGVQNREGRKQVRETQTVKKDTRGRW
jgi:hypothetical protein